jgi:predicted nucleic acid-binding Zn ribbon protein
MTYSKTCKICGKAFESDSKNAVYCSDKCAKRGAKKAYRSRKMKHINAVKRGDDKEIEALITSAYKLSRDIAKMCLHKKCMCTDKDHVCSGELHVHHKNHIIWDNRPQNLQWLCEKAHHEIHNQEEDVSIIEEIRAFITIRKQEEIRERNLIRQKKRESNKE